MCSDSLSHICNEIQQLRAHHYSSLKVYYVKSFSLSLSFSPSLAFFRSFQVTLNLMRLSSSATQHNLDVFNEISWGNYQHIFNVMSFRPG